jgi:transcriptional regulator with XRE-family HTH domain
VVGGDFSDIMMQICHRIVVTVSLHPLSPRLASPYIGLQQRELVMNTPGQIRASRVLLGWDQHDLASAAGVDRSTIQRMEHLGPEHCERTNVSKVREALEAAGILFIKGGLEGAGVRLSRSREFLDDLIRTVSQGSAEADQKLIAKAHLESFVLETKRFFKGDVNEEEQVGARLSELRTLLENEIKRRKRPETAGLFRYVCSILTSSVTAC